MKRVIIGCLIALTNIAYAQLTLQLDPSTAVIGQTVRLILNTDSPQAGDMPDLGPLMTDFEVIGTTRSSSYTITNGQTQSSNQWVIFLRPKRVGIIPIPVLTIGHDNTIATTITISSASNINQSSTSKSNPQTTGDKKDIMLLSEIDEKQPYVNQQIIYTVKLLNSLQLANVNYQGPSVNDALMFPLGDSYHSEVYQNGHTYSVEEQKYAIFPQKSGKLIIQPPQINALIYDDQPQPVHVQAPILTPEIIAAKSIEKNWLPAKNVTLTEQYDKNNVILKQGSTLTRTITIQAVGMPAQLLPQLVVENKDGFQAYFDKAIDKNNVYKSDLIGSRTIHVTYLFDKPGVITIPVLSIPWFNSTTHKKEHAMLPATTMTIVATADKTTVSNHPKKNSLNNTKVISGALKKERLPWIIAIVLGLAWLITLLLWWLRQGLPLKKKFPTMRYLLNELKKACLNNEPEATKIALLNWAHLQWPDKKILTILDISQLHTDPGLKKELEILSDVLYHPSKPTWQGAPLWSFISIEEKRTPNLNKKSPIPPINPS